VTSCPGCGLDEYEGMCPHCSGDQDAYERELVPPFPSSLEREPDDDCLHCGRVPIDHVCTYRSTHSNTCASWIAPLHRPCTCGLLDEDATIKKEGAR
jgi:hypothetical protein